jgi:hypothetical protein
MRAAFLAVVFVVLAVSVFWCGVAEPPANISAGIDAPVRVAVDSEFDITITLSNSGNRPATLTDLHVRGEWPEGVMVKSTTPAFTSAAELPGLDAHSYRLDLDLLTGETKVTVRALALHPGDWRGEFDLWIDPGWRLLTYPVRTIVE